MKAMSEGTENIESRLAAYIDGELAEKDRAEIEQYLAANPGHQQLIDELRTQRSQIASIPRERAPVEVLDHLQSHLERQSLLEHVEDGVGSMRINHWPQWTAVAAMLLLTVGLGALVFSVLPGGALNRESIAIAPPSLQDLPTAPTLDEKDNPADAALRKRDMPDNRDAVAAAGGGGAMEENRGQDFVEKMAAELEADAKTPKPVRDFTAAGLKSENALASADKKDDSSIALNNGSAIVVSTDDPMITQNLLAGYLGQNGVEFQPVRAEIAQSLPSLEAKMTFSAKDSVDVNIKGRFDSQQQVLGSVVQRVNMKENGQVTGEQYLLVRNVSPDDAKRLNTIINTQRGARQQARFYGNADLYPENVAEQSAMKGQIEPLHTSQQQMNAPLSSDPAKQQAAVAQKEEAKQDVVPADGHADGAIVQEGNSNPTQVSQQAQTDATLQLTAKPEAQANIVQNRTDILIVVRNDLPANPRVDGAQPANALSTTGETTSSGSSTQPSTAPAAVVPAEPTNTLPAPTTVPAVD